MEFSIKNKDVKAQFWTLPGPLVIGCILMAISFRQTPTPLILPLIALAGYAACHLWRWMGVAVSTAFLAVALVYFLQAQPSQSWMWTIILSLSMACAFVVVVLCSEEACHSVDALSKGSHDHKKLMSHLNERLQASQANHTVELTALHLQITQLQEQLSSKEDKQRSNEQLIRLARSEITSIYQNQQSLLQELAEERQNAAVREAKISELEELAALSAKNSHALFHIESLNQQLEASQQCTERLNEALVAAAAEKQKLEASNISLKQEIENLQHFLEQAGQAAGAEKQKLEALNISLKQEIENLQHFLEQAGQAAAAEKQKLEASNVSLNEELEKLQHDLKELKGKGSSPAHSSEMRRIEGLYQQLREQFEEKTEVLAATRRELFMTQEKVSTLQKEKDELALYGEREPREVLQQLVDEAEKELAELEEQYEEEIVHLHELIDSLTASLSTLSTQG